MPTKKHFDLIVLVAILLHPVVGLVKLDARRMAREEDGVLGQLGEALATGL